MSIYPPNNTTPKSPSGSYLWNWLGSPLKKFAAALAPYLGDGYSYTEINISSAELINPGSIPEGTNGIPMGYSTGKELLPPCAANQYYEWKYYMEFTPGSSTYTDSDNIKMIPAGYTGYLDNSNSNPIDIIGTNVYGAWKGTNIDTGNAGSIAGGCGLYASWGSGNWLDGDGTMKVKLWYKVVNFG